MGEGEDWIYWEIPVCWATCCPTAGQARPELTFQMEKRAGGGHPKILRVVCISPLDLGSGFAFLRVLGYRLMLVV